MRRLYLRVQMKCDQYWPARGTDTYGLIHVSVVDVVELATYTVRTFQLARVRLAARSVACCHLVADSEIRLMSP